MGEKKDKRNGIEENRVGGFISWRKVSSLTLILVVVSRVGTRAKKGAAQRFCDLFARYTNHVHAEAVRFALSDSNPWRDQRSRIHPVTRKRYFDGVNTSITFPRTRSPTFSSYNTTFDLQFSFGSTKRNNSR